MRVRYLGHSCIEIIGRHHILIDPDFTRDPEPGVEFICVTHAHKDHIGRVAEIPTGAIVASQDVCEIAGEMGVNRERLLPVTPGEQIANIQILPGYSMVNDPRYTFFYILFRWRFPDAGGTPLSFLIKDEATLLHIGDAHNASLHVQPDILCLPWRKSPVQPKRYKDNLVKMGKQFAAPYILPIHHDLPYARTDPSEIDERLNAVILHGSDWYQFRKNRLF